MGESRAFADALAEVFEAHGGRVLLRALVEHTFIERGRAAGVILAGGQIHRAVAVISNADVRKTFLELVGWEHLPPDFARRVEGLEFSTLAFAVFLGVDFVPGLELVMLVHAEDGRGLGIMTPSWADPGLAPLGHAAITLLTLILRAEATAWGRRAPGYVRRKRAFGNALVALAGQVLPGLWEHVVFREEASLATFAFGKEKTARPLAGSGGQVWSTGACASRRRPVAHRFGRPSDSVGRLTGFSGGTKSRHPALCLFAGP